MHPLAPDLSKLSTEELNNKYGDLLKRITYAMRIGQSEMIEQLQMLLSDYQNELNDRNRRALEDMEKNSKNFKNLIDIK
jgi:hypothetical protein